MDAREAKRKEFSGRRKYQRGGAAASETQEEISAAQQHARQLLQAGGIGGIASGSGLARSGGGVGGGSFDRRGADGRRRAQGQQSGQFLPDTMAVVAAANLGVANGMAGSSRMWNDNSTVNHMALAMESAGLSSAAPDANNSINVGAVTWPSIPTSTAGRSSRGSKRINYEAIQVFSGFQLYFFGFHTLFDGHCFFLFLMLLYLQSLYSSGASSTNETEPMARIPVNLSATSTLQRGISGAQRGSSAGAGGGYRRNVSSTMPVATGNALGSSALNDIGDSVTGTGRNNASGRLNNSATRGGISEQSDMQEAIRLLSGGGGNTSIVSSSSSALNRGRRTSGGVENTQRSTLLSGSSQNANQQNNAGGTSNTTDPTTTTNAANAADPTYDDDDYDDEDNVMMYDDGGGGGYDDDDYGDEYY